MLLEAIGAALHERFLGVTTYQTRSDISIIAIVTVSGTISRMVMASHARCLVHLQRLHLRPKPR
jgi:hypothetical protein